MPRIIRQLRAELNTYRSLLTERSQLIEAFNDLGLLGACDVLRPITRKFSVKSIIETYDGRLRILEMSYRKQLSSSALTEADDLR